MAQQCEFQEPPTPPALLGGAGGGQRESQNGWYMTPHGTVRVLLVLAEVVHRYRPRPHGSRGHRRVASPPIAHLGQ